MSFSGAVCVLPCRAGFTSQREARWGGPWGPWLGEQVQRSQGAPLGPCRRRRGQRPQPRCFVWGWPCGAPFVGVASAAPSFSQRTLLGTLLSFPRCFSSEGLVSWQGWPLPSGPHASGGLPTGPSQRVSFPRRQRREHGHLGCSAPWIADRALCPGGTPSEGCSPGRVPGESFPGDSAAHCPLSGGSSGPASPSPQLSLCTCPLAVSPGGTGLLSAEGARLSPLLSPVAPGVS